MPSHYIWRHYRLFDLEQHMGSEVMKSPVAIKELPSSCGFEAKHKQIIEALGWIEHFVLGEIRKWNNTFTL